jgi:hypothetical protein
MLFVSLIYSCYPTLIYIYIYIYYILHTHSDQVMGGISTGHISRELIHHRMANVMRGAVSLANRGGFIQMATNFATMSNHDDTTTTTIANVPTFKNSFRTAIPIDASKYTGIELDVNCDTSENFNVQYVVLYKCNMSFLLIGFHSHK